VDYKTPLGIAPVLQVHPLNRCNIACNHCYTSSEPDRGEELSIQLLRDCLEDAVALGYRQLAVSGGEPLLYKSLIELLSSARTLGMITTVTTNGMLLTPHRWEGLSELIDVTAISIDGTPEEHDTIRRHPGAFARTLANLEVVRSSGVAFGFIFTLTQYNVNSLEFVVRLAAEQGANSVQVHPLTLVGRAANTLLDARPDAVELSAALYEASSLGAKLGVVIHVDALIVDQLLKFRDCFIPKAPVINLVDVAPILIIQADTSVVPLTHEVNRSLHLGSLTNARLALLAQDWLNAGMGKRLADVYERTWSELITMRSGMALTWYDEVSLRTQ
jgi:MoaA/NifB/PqqE/SkfB family radical SAM enzyme